MDDYARPLTIAYATCCIIDLFGVFPIITLPRPIIDCGWLGIPLAFTIFGIQVYTAIILGKCWIIGEQLYPELCLKKRTPYPALTEFVLGQRAAQVVSFLLDVGIFGATIPNLLIASQNMQLLGLKLSQHRFDFSFCYWLIILGFVLCPLIWLGSPKDMKWLALTSVLTVSSVSMLTWYCIMSVSVDGPVVHPDPSWKNVAIAYGILAFQFDIHPTILSVQMDMENPEKLTTSIITSFLVTGGLFTITTSIAYVQLGNGAYLNILQGLPPSGALYLNIGLVTAQIFLSIVIGTSALFQHIEHKLKIPSEFNFYRCILRSSLVGVLVILGGCVPRFDLIMGLIGGCLTGPLVFILPPILYTKIKQMERTKWCPKFNVNSEQTSLLTLRNHVTYFKELQSHSRTFHAMSNQEKCLNHIIVILGVIATVLSTYFSLSNTITYAQFSPSCAMNFTAASELLF